MLLNWRVSIQLCIRKQCINKTAFTNNIITVADYCYNYFVKQHVSALLGHHKAYKTAVLVKVHVLNVP